MPTVTVGSARCRPRAATGWWLPGDRHYGGAKVGYHAKLMDLSSGAGCVAVSGSWLEPNAVVATGDKYQVDCHELSASSGDAVAFGAQTPVYGAYPHSMLIAADGQPACTSSYDALGCELQGVAPYRLVTWTEYDPGVARVDRDVAVRLVGPGTDCPLIAPAGFGEVPADDLPGVGCRRFAGTAGGAVFVRGIKGTGREDLTTVYNPDRSRGCGRWLTSWCPTPTSGDYLLVGSLFDTTFRTTLLDAAGTTGCTAQKANLEKRTHRLAAGQLRCASLPLRAGSLLGIVRDIRSLNDKPPVTILDATGAQVCTTVGENETSLLDCALDGVAPFRAVVGVGEKRGPSTTAYLRLDKPSTCTTLKMGKSHTRKLVLAKGAFAKCYRATAGQRARTERISIRRTKGKDVVEIAAAGLRGVSCSPFRRAANLSMTCTVRPKSFGYPIVVTSRGKSGTFLVTRTKAS